MRRPSIGEFNLGALAGAVTGSTGGLFAVGVVRAILDHNIVLVFRFPILGLLGFIICGGVGWLIGGQIGPRFGEKYYSQRAEYAGGGLGGLIPVLLVALWAWYMSTH